MTEQERIEILSFLIKFSKNSSNVEFSCKDTEFNVEFVIRKGVFVVNVWYNDKNDKYGLGCKGAIFENGEWTYKGGKNANYVVNNVIKSYCELYNTLSI